MLYLFAYKYFIIIILNNNLFLEIKNYSKIIYLGLGIGDWGLGIGDWGLGPIPNPQSPIPNPQELFNLIMIILKSKNNLIQKLNIK